MISQYEQYGRKSYLKAKAAGKTRWQTHKEECKKQCRRYYAEHKEEISRKLKEKYIENPSLFRSNNLKQSHGITLIEYETLYESQDGKYKICGLKKKLSVDHDHETGRIRGLLCVNCNTMLGQCFDNTEILKSGIKYLET